MAVINAIWQLHQICLKADKYLNVQTRHSFLGLNRSEIQEVHDHVPNPNKVSYILILAPWLQVL